MNDTEKILNEIMNTLEGMKLIKKASITSLASYLGVSRNTIYNLIKDDRITIKIFKQIKKDENIKHIYISDCYIIDRILMGL